VGSGAVGQSVGDVCAYLRHAGRDLLADVRFGTAYGPEFDEDEELFGAVIGER
jgi:hypothetical protein